MVTPITNCSIPLPVFTGKKYDFWSLKLKTYFISQNLWDIVENGVKVYSSALSRVERKNLEEQRQKDAQALFVIQQAVEDTIFTEIKDADTAKKAWYILEEKFDCTEKGRGCRSESITHIDRKLYEAAAQGNFDVFNSVENIEDLVTPKKNNILHVYLTSQTPSEQFVEQVLNKFGVQVLQPNAKGETPLHIAARYGHSGLVKLLIDRAKDFPHQDIENGMIGWDKKLIRAKNHVNNDTALHEAVRFRHVEVVKTLLLSDPAHSYSANEGNIETPLYLAAERRYIDGVLNILEVSISPAYDGPNGRTALHAAAINGSRGIAKRLLEKDHLRAMIKHADKQGWVPLHHAVKRGHYNMTKWLLEQDGDTAYMQDKEGRTALNIAAHCGHWIIMEMIIESYPDCSEIADNKGWNVVHHVVHGKSYHAMRQIVRNPMLSNLYNEKDVDGNTPFHHLAVSPENESTLAFQRGVDIMAMNNAKETVFDLLVQNSYFAAMLIKQTRTLKISWNFFDAGVMPSRRQHQERTKNYETEFLYFDSEKARESHLLVATIIATVSFAAGFTLPGGFVQDGHDNQGTAILRKRAAFRAFIISDTIALVLSASAAFMHLFPPLIKDKFELQRAFFSETALSFTLVAVAAMIVAFATGIYAALGSAPLGIAVLILGMSFFVVFWRVVGIGFPQLCIRVIFYFVQPFIVPFQAIFHLGLLLLEQK